MSLWFFLQTLPFLSISAPGWLAGFQTTRKGKGKQSNTKKKQRKQRQIKESKEKKRNTKKNKGNKGENKGK